MRGPTHLTLGIASALAIIRPTTVPGIITAITAGGLGGWIVDIDIRQSLIKRKYGFDYEDEDDDDDETRIRIKRTDVFDAIIDALFIAAFIAVDYIVGGGMCEYIKTHWGSRAQIGLIAFFALVLLGFLAGKKNPFNRGHRRFTHSIMAMLLFTAALNAFCAPAAFPFMIGYFSHIVADLFNKKGEQILWPIPWRPCFNLCYSDKKANDILFRICVIADFIEAGTLFALALMYSGGQSDFVYKFQTARIFGLNTLQLYLIFINLISFIGMQVIRRDYESGYYDNYDMTDEFDEDVRKSRQEFSTWLVDLLVFLGGGIGMLLAFIFGKQYPSGYNGTWWSFLEASLLFWFVVYSYVVNPFGWTISAIDWASPSHRMFYGYLIIINVISALSFFIFRHKYPDEYSTTHTFLIFMGMIGGAFGGMLTVLLTFRNKRTFNYAITGFPLIILGQIVFSLYMMIVQVF